MDLDSFEEGSKTYDAVERCLERISEPAAKLGNLAPAWMPDQPWQKIGALGNRLRHRYARSGKTALGYRSRSIFPRYAPPARILYESRALDKRDEDCYAHVSTEEHSARLASALGSDLAGESPAPPAPPLYAASRYSPNTTRNRSEISPTVACNSAASRINGSRLAEPRAACSNRSSP